MTFRPRRPHQKSRNGCLTCKHKRVKCDEIQPICARCTLFREECQYPDRTNTQAVIPMTNPVRRLLINQLRLPGRTTVDAAPSSLVIDSTNILEITCADIPLHKLEASPQFQATMVIELLHHFEQTACATLGNPMLAASFQKHKCPSPMLLDAVLAFSALHLQTLHPNEVRFKLATTCMGLLATQLFRQKVQEGPPKYVREMADICSAYVILSAFAFYSEDCDPSSSLLFSSHPWAPGWLCMVPNFSTLLQQLGAPAQALTKGCPQLTQQSHGPSYPAVLNDCQPSAFIPLLRKLCQGATFSAQRQDTYMKVVRQLTSILNHDSSTVAFWQLPTELESITEYTRLICDRDPVALLLLSYYLAKLCTITCWWSDRRASVECQAICAYLDSYGDVEICDLLEFPKRAYAIHAA